MDANLKAQWVAALRSGEYDQGHGALKLKWRGVKGQRSFYCCLGVLCDLIDPDGWDDNLWTHADADPVHNEGYSSSYALLPFSLVEKVGFTQDGQLPEVTDRSGFRMTLAALNDSGDFTFSQIADIVENQF